LNATERAGIVDGLMARPTTILQQNRILVRARRFAR
jgi:hypothetical protein